jgi:hypothetical protein
MDNEIKINDIVLCIDDSIKPGMEEFVFEAYLNWIRKGKEYTVRGFTEDNGIVTGVYLEEILNFPIYIHLIDKVQEPAFRLSRFVKTQSAIIEESDEVEEVLVKESSKPFDVFENFLN